MGGERVKMLNVRLLLKYENNCAVTPSLHIPHGISKLPMKKIPLSKKVTLWSVNIIWTWFLGFNYVAFSKESLWVADLIPSWTNKPLRGDGLWRWLCLCKWIDAFKGLWFEALLGSKRNCMQWGHSNGRKSMGAYIWGCTFCPASSLTLPTAALPPSHCEVTHQKARNNGASRPQSKTNKSSFKLFPSHIYHSNENFDTHTMTLT